MTRLRETEKPGAALARNRPLFMDTENVAKATMMNRLHDALTGDEFYLIAMALANLETSFSEQPANTVAGFGTHGETVYDRIMLGREPGVPIPHFRDLNA